MHDKSYLRSEAISPIKLKAVCILLVGLLSLNNSNDAFAEQGTAVSNINTRVFRSQYEGMKKVSVRADVTNNSSKAEQVEVVIQGIDKDGFEIEHWILRGSVDARQTKQLSSSEDVDEDAFSTIVKWKLEE